MNTGVYDKQAKAVINKKLRDVDKRLSAYCMQVVSGGDADSLAGEFASDVGASIEDGETQVSVTASDMGHAMSEEARKKIHYSPDADLIATLSAASLQSYRSWEDRTSAGDVLKGFAAQTKDAVSLLPSGTNAERAAKLAEYLKKPATIVADSEGSAVRPQKALFSNLRRLVVSDIATAYRVVEKRIWNALPFVVGYEVLLGDNHRKIDMCDDLQGIYPKDFDFFGWHPWCRCFARPIFSWESEKVTEMPENFNTWIEDNKERIERARERGTLPRWIKDNPKYVGVTQNTIPESVKGTHNTKSTTLTELRVRIEAKRKYDSYGSDWRKEYFNKENGGYNVYHKLHQFSNKRGERPSKNGGETKKSKMTGGEAEKHVGRILADTQAKQIEFLPENGRGTDKPDLKFDGKTWDVKYIPLANEKTIRTYYKEARKAQAVIFYSEKSRNVEILSAVNREKGRYISLGKDISELPKVYVMNEDGILRLLE